MRKTDSFKIGSLFQGRRIIRRMDSGRKPFREVYLCSSDNATEQVLILYKNSLTPDCMLDFGTMCPVEYYRRIHLHGDDAKGLPELLDYGQTDIYTWMFEESFLQMPTLETLCNIFNLTPSGKRCGQDFAKEILKHTIISTPLLNNDSNDSPKMLLPGNIRCKSEDTGLSTAITGLDEMFAPEYYDTEAIYPYYYIGNEVQIPDYHKIFDVRYSLRGLIKNRADCS